MELQNERLFDLRERIVRRWLILAVAALAGLGFPAAWFGPRIYSHLQQQRLLRKARQSATHHEVRNVALLLHRVLHLNANNVDAARAMADLADAHAPEEAPALRERVCRLAPASYPDATAWALAALRVGRIDQAEDAFEVMEKIGASGATFHEIAGRIALARGHLDEARGQFRRALALDPAHEGNQLELATLDIRLPDPEGRRRGRETLERLRQHPGLRHAALRALVGDRVENGTLAEALVLAPDFVNDPATTFQDRLQYLGILRAKEDPSFVFTNAFDEKSQIRFGVLPESRVPTFAAYLNDLQAEARADAGKVAALVAFLTSRGLSLLAAEWTGTLPRKFVASPPIAPPLAEAYRLLLDWRRLEEFLAVADWGEAEFLRLAYGARVLQEKGDRGGAAAQWAAAVKGAGYHPERMAALARTAFAWGWSGEYEEMLWLTARKTKRPRAALEELARLYGEQRDTQKLFTVWSRILELDPADVSARKHWVRLSLLLNNERFRTGTIAHELYRQHPTDPEIATSYALVLHFRLQEREGLAVMKRLPPEQLRVPSVAGYYAALLAANRQRDEAAEFLALAQGATLLREEAALLDQTRRALDPAPSRR